MPARKTRKIFVLDTSVIVHDHSAVLHFQEHDIALPITVLEELDQFKKGNDVLHFEARQFIRFLDTLTAGRRLTDWLSLGPKKGRLKVVMPVHPAPPGVADANQLFGGGSKNDHLILNCALQLQHEFPKDSVVLVSKDINLRIKARALNLPAEDYATDKVENPAGLPPGSDRLDDVPPEALGQLLANGVLDAQKILKKRVPAGNHYYVLRALGGKLSCLAFYRAETGLLEKLDKVNASGIKPRNAEQTFALHALLNPAVKLVTIQGVAGTGKTLLALAAALEQRREFKQVFLSRPVVALGNKDLGFLPGDANRKMAPYMEPLFDNLRVIQNQFPDSSKEAQRLKELQQHEKLLIAPLAYIRGRSLSDVFFIIDEAQNLTPQEVKTVISRAGDNTKIVFTGDIYQIDTPYLDAQSNGLSYLIDRAHQNALCAHVTLTTGQRSELANLANELL